MTKNEVFEMLGKLELTRFFLNIYAKHEKDNLKELINVISICDREIEMIKESLFQFVTIEELLAYQNEYISKQHELSEFMVENLTKLTGEGENDDKR